jgi:type IV fimbrial biogenesis protein FimT
MRKRGITLVELVVVMAIIAIGAAFVAPNIGAWLPNYRLRSATRDVTSVLRTAQMKAISNNTQYHVSFNPGAGSYILQYQDTGGNWIDDGTAENLPQGILISNIGFPGNNAQFNPNSTSSTGSITLSNTKGAKKTITLTVSTGKVNVN